MILYSLDMKGLGKQGETLLYQLSPHWIDNFIILKNYADKCIFKLLRWIYKPNRNEFHSNILNLASSTAHNCAVLWISPLSCPIYSKCSTGSHCTGLTAYHLLTQHWKRSQDTGSLLKWEFLTTFISLVFQVSFHYFQMQ